MRAVCSRHCLHEFSAIIMVRIREILSSMDWMFLSADIWVKTHPISLMIRPTFCSYGVLSLSRVLTVNIFIVVSRRQNTGSGDNCQTVTIFERES